jgi:formylglycine-generating enzyme required for sulfatase activity
MPRLTDRLTAFIQKLSQRIRAHTHSSQAAQPAGSIVAQVMFGSLGSPNPKSLRQAYLNNMIANLRPVSVASLQFSGNGPASSLFLLDRLYVTPDTRTRVESKSSESETENSRALSTVEAVTREAGQRMVLLGPPGAGKSAFLCFLALQHARALNSAETAIEKLLPDWSAPPLLPVLISLNSLSKGLDPQESDDEIIEKYLHTDDNSRLYAAHLLEEADRIGGLFLFDGLDEIADPTRQSLLVQALQAFASRHSAHPATRFIVTCRSLSYAEPGWQLQGWTTHQLAPLSEEKIRQYVENWYDEIIRTDLARRTYHEDKRTRLLASLRSGDPSRLWELAGNPLLLSTLTAAHADKDGLPEPRVLIYQACVDYLLTHWTIESGQAAGKFQMRLVLDFLQVPRAAFLSLLQEIAYQAHALQLEPLPGQEAYSNSLISEERLSSILQTHLGSEEKVQNALAYFRQPNGMLTVHRVTLPQETPADLQQVYAYAFLHPAIEEYLAALHLARKADLGLEARQHISRGSRWREVLLLLGEHICFSEADVKRIDGILNALAPAPLPQEGLPPDGWRAIWIAGELLNTYRRTFPQRDQEHRHIPRGLVNLLQARGTSLPANERAAAGDVLDALGDPRFRAEAWFLPDEALLGFLRIPAGPFSMGSDPFLDPAAKETEQPQHEVNLPDFYIARNLVTVAQYKTFVEDSGYQPANTGSLLGRLSRPVVYVGWRDALRYCAWLTEKLKEMAARRVKDWALSETEKHFWIGLKSGELVATLPSEAEWEKAARGPIADSKEGSTTPRNNSIYPWGNEFDPNKANTAETGLGTTSPVGCFSMGASPYGILDMAGNVWEWTRTLWGNDFINSSFFYPYIQSDGRENLQANDSVLRVIRGGSFFYHSWHTRISSRGRSIPPEWDWDIGFRVAITAFKSSSRRTEKW